MNLANLLEAIELQVADREIPIWLATRLERSEEVQIITVGGISVDEDSQELLLLSANWVQDDEISNITTVDDFRNWAAGVQEQYGDFGLYGAQKQVALPDGGFARSCDSLIGWFLPNNPTALWLLFSPLDQWPSEWFSA